PVFTAGQASSPAATADLPNQDADPALESATGAAVESTNSVPNQFPAKVVQTPALPDDIKASPALAEVIKLAHAGVSDEIMLAYIANSPVAFNVSSDQIVYLNDLGVSPTVITSLIQHDKLPAVAANKFNQP